MRVPLKKSNLRNHLKIKKSVSLVEVIVGALILATAFGGLLASFISARRYINRVNKRLITANLIRGALNELYKDVRQDTWNAGDLRIHTEILPNYTIDNLSYSGGAANNNYVVVDCSVAGNCPTVGSYRRVDATMHYPED